MFIVSKRNYMVKRADGSLYEIKKDFVGEIPKDVAESNLVRRAIRGGMISVPEGKKDKQLEKADKEAKKKAGKKDIRPDSKENPEENSQKEPEEDNKEVPSEE